MRAILQINQVKYNILRFHYSFHRQINVVGRPVTGLLGGEIHVELESDEDTSILEEMVANYSRKTNDPLFPLEVRPIRGSIRMIGDYVGTYKELVFQEAYIYNYREKMNAEGKEPMTVYLSISATQLSIDRVIHLDRRTTTTKGYYWKEYREEYTGRNVTVEYDKEAAICDAYWMDKQGNKRRNSFPNSPFTLYIQVDNPVIGNRVNLNINFKAEGAYRCSQLSGVVNESGLIIIENFEFKKEENE